MSSPAPQACQASLELAIRAMPEDVLGEFVQRRRLRGGRRGWYLDFRAVAEGAPETRIWSDQGTPFRSQRHAETVVAAILQEHKDRLPWEAIVSRYRGKRAQKDTVREWFDRYLEHKRHQFRADEIGQTRLGQVERITRQHLVAFAPFATSSIYDLKDGDVVRLFAWITEKGLASSSRQSIRNVLSDWRRFVERQNRRAGVPQWIGPTLPSIRVEDREVSVLSEDLQREVIGSMPRRQQGIYLVMALSIRPGEARALLASDYREGGLSITKACKTQQSDSPVRAPKTGRHRWIPIDDSGHWAAAELLEWLGELGHLSPTVRRLLFPGRRLGQVLSHSAVWKCWRNACERIGVPAISLYEGTRHTLATQLYELGASDDEIRGVLGHRPGTRSIESYRVIRQKVATVTTMSRFRSAFARAKSEP